MKSFLAATLFVAAALPLYPSDPPPARPKSGKVEILKLADVKSGMKAVAWTVFSGTEPEPVPIAALPPEGETSEPVNAGPPVPPRPEPVAPPKPPPASPPPPPPFMEAQQDDGPSQTAVLAGAAALAILLLIILRRRGS